MNNKKKIIYKVQKSTGSARNSDRSSPHQGTTDTEGKIDNLDNRFLAIRTQQQRYIGRQCIVVFLRDATKKIRTKFLQK